jgi:FdhD protein
MNPYIKRKIIKREDASFEEIEDYIALEKRLKISVNGKDFISLYCTPLMIKELVVGFLLTEGLITEIPPEELRIEYGEEILVNISIAGDVLTEGLITSSYVSGVTSGKKKIFEKVKDNFSLKAEILKIIFKEFNQRSELFRLTGCFHGAALSDGERILVFAEDIGRHNVVDKVIGYSILENIPFYNKLMLLSCRLSSEIVSKCLRWNIPVVASRAAPTDLAIGIAETSGITVVGFVRDDRMNIYTNSQRIIQ